MLQNTESDYNPEPLTVVNSISRPSRSLLRKGPGTLPQPPDIENSKRDTEYFVLVTRPLRIILIQKIAGMMSRALVLFLMVATISLSGCDTLQKKHENPVMSSAPRRVNKVEPEEQDAPQFADEDPEKTEVAEKQKEDDGSNIEKVSATLKKASRNPWDDWQDDSAIFNSQVAATVNGVPILNGDILDRYTPMLINLRTRMQEAARNPKLLEPGQPMPTPEDYEQARYRIIQGEIAVHVEKRLLVERLKAGLKPEQLKMMNGHIDELFEKEVEDQKKHMKVSNRTELELELNKRGSTLQNLKDDFALNRLAQECIGLKSEKPDPIERPHLVAYYQSHPDEFKVAAKVKWQQIQVSISPEVGEKSARKKMEQALAELKRGVSFDKVAKKYSDGPTAKDGGAWDWMEAGNLADTKLEAKLFSAALNELSDIHETEFQEKERNSMSNVNLTKFQSLTVFRVTDRQSAGRKPFKEVQKEIYSILEMQQNKKRKAKLYRELFSQAEIESQYSLPQFVPEE